MHLTLLYVKDFFKKSQKAKLKHNLALYLVIDLGFNLN